MPDANTPRFAFSVNPTQLSISIRASITPCRKNIDSQKISLLRYFFHWHVTNNLQIFSVNAIEKVYQALSKLFTISATEKVYHLET